jgi:hypothetical protein
MAKNCAFSLRDSRDHPSAILLGTDMAARVTCPRMPKRYSGGRPVAHRHATSASSIAFIQITASR